MLRKLELLFALGMSLIIASCTKEDPMPDIYGDYVIRDIYWKGEKPLDLDNDGCSTRFLVDELRTLAANDFFIWYSTLHGSGNSGDVAFRIPLQNLTLDRETGEVDELALRGGSFGISLHFKYADGKFDWSTFESFEKEVGLGSFDTNRYDIVHLKNGHVVSTEKGKIVLSINVSYYDYATGSIVSGPEEITYMRLK